MSGKLLRALMELFAIVATINNGADKGIKTVRLFLKQQLSLDDVDSYLEEFEAFFQKHMGNPKKKKRTSVNHSVKGLLICQQINEEITQKQKLFILVRLLEFIAAGEAITEDELDFVETIALEFNFSEIEFKHLKAYVTEENHLSSDNANTLLLSPNDASDLTEGHHLKVPGLDGVIIIFKVSSQDSYLIKYIGKENILLNGFPMERNLVYPFVNGSAIRNNLISTIYYSDITNKYMSDVVGEKVYFEAKGITYVFPGNKIGLHDINFMETSGNMVGIMGASGAGKTTLLNVLSGINKPTTGDIKINEKSIYSDSEEVKGLIGYIAQDDLLFEELTVYENLFYNAQLCMGGLSNEEIHDKVINILKSLGLAEIKDLIVGSPLNKKISGGQRKRLNIGLELIREPYVLFVDEPTSGLSSRDSENIMDLLKELALKGKLVIIVIHQPSSDIFKMFDKLFIMDTGGYPVYYGDPVDAISYFKRNGNYVQSQKSLCGECGNVNPEQIFNILEAKVVNEYGKFLDKRKVSPIVWNERFKETFSLEKITNIFGNLEKNLHLTPSLIPDKLKQLFVFIKRDVKSKLSNKQYMVFTFSEAPLLAFILAFLVRFFNIDEGGTNNYVFGENENLVAYLFMSVVVALFLGMIVSAEEIFKDQKIRKRESFLNLSKGSYLFSKIIILFSISAIQTLTYVFVGNLVLDIDGLFFSYWLILFSTSCFANLLGLNISSTFNSAVTIYILIPIFLIPQLMLSGAVVKFDKLNPSISSSTHVPFTGEIIASKWAFEALCVNQYKNNRYEKLYYKINKNKSICEYKTSYHLPKLITKNEYCLQHAKSTDESVVKLKRKYIALLNNEIPKSIDAFKKLIKDYPSHRNRLLSSLPKKEFTPIDPDNFKGKAPFEMSAMLNKLKKGFSKVFNIEDKRKEQVTKNIIKKHGQQFLIDLKKNYHNEELKKLVCNTNDENRIIEANGEYIQKIHPVYLDPYIYTRTNPLDTRAHLFAPRKQFFGYFIGTETFNVLVLWFMTICLWLTLYFDLFRQFLNKMESIISSKS